jgi:hypothetical protein
MKSGWLFAFLPFLSLLFSLIGCADSARLGLYHYVYAPAPTVALRLYPVYLDKGFGEADRISIQEALDQWNTALHGQARFVIVNPHFDPQPAAVDQVDKQQGFVIVKLNGSISNPLIDRADQQAKEEMGKRYYSASFTQFIGSHHIYLIRDRMTNDSVRFILTHELGHALGAQHGGDGLMSVPWSKEKWQCVDRYTMQQVAEHERLRVENLNYCVVGRD